MVDARMAAVGGMVDSLKTWRSRVYARENGVQLDDSLNIFGDDGFNAENYVRSKCRTLNEKEMRELFSSLLSLKKESAEEMRRSVYSNYTAFIRTSKEILDLEGELSAIRNSISTQSALLHGLAEGVTLDSPPSASTDPYGSSRLGESSELEKWCVEFPDRADVVLAERRVDEALQLFSEAEHLYTEAEDSGTLSPAVLLSFRESVTEKKLKLAGHLTEASCHISTRGSVLRESISALKELGDESRAHTLLLEAYSRRLHYNLRSLHPSTTSYGGAYTAALSQLVFSAIARASADSNRIFGGRPGHQSELVVWATKQAEMFSLLVNRHVLSSSAAAGGLRAAAECVQIAIGHCFLLEAQGLALSSVLLRRFRPCVEQALDANLKRIEESTAAFAAADDWTLAYPTTTRSGRGSRISSTGSNNLSTSAFRFNLMVQDFFEDVGPLVSMQLGGRMLEGLFRVFDFYVNTLIRALPRSMEEEEGEEEELIKPSVHKMVRMAESEVQQVALLANASLLADELLPRAAVKLLQQPVGRTKCGDDANRVNERQPRNPEQREWRRRLVGSVDRLKDSFCRQNALDLIFTEDGHNYLSADIYTNLDQSSDDVQPFPSSIFQEVFRKVNGIAEIAGEMFVGRERFGTLVLMRLTETVILWLSNDQSFWDDLQDGPNPFGPLALQQLYMDMKFVMEFASQGRYLSRYLNRVVNDIISRAFAIFSSSSSHSDPSTVLPEEEWFTEICEEAVERLTGKTKGVFKEPELSSPTPSLSSLPSIASV